MNPSIEQFYASNMATVPLLVSRDGYYRTAPNQLLLRRTAIPTRTELAEKIAETYHAISGVISQNQSYCFEMATVNGNATEGDVLIAATYNSSLTSNAGNVFEFATKAAMDPTHRYTYIALPGNGLSSVLTKKERRHLAENGSLLDHTEDGADTLPFADALTDVIRRRGLEPEQHSSD